MVLIGAGGRANAYLTYGAKEEYNLLAIADPNAADMSADKNTPISLTEEWLTDGLSVSTDKGSRRGGSAPA